MPATRDTTAASTPTADAAFTHVDRIHHLEIYNWQDYIPHNTKATFDSYYSQLFHEFDTANGDNRWSLHKSKAMITIKDGKNAIFHCGRTTSNIRNLLLEFHDCRYLCDVWAERFLTAHNFEAEHNQNVKTP